MAYCGVFLPALGWSCGTVLHTSVPAYRGFLPENPLFFGFLGAKIGKGGFLQPEPSSKSSKTLELGLVWGIFVCSGLVLQNSAAHSVSAYRHQKTMKLGFVPKETNKNLFFELYTPKIGEGGSSYPNVLQNYQKPSNLAYFGVFF